MAKNFKGSMFKPIKQKECRECKELFTPYNSLQVCCSPKCATEHAKKKVWKKEKAERIDKLRTRTDWLNLLQVVFNTYIRLRDAKSGCITCLKPFNDKYDAGHFFSVGSYPALRFNEDNVHGQCVHCNQHLHSNNAEYFIQLPKRIGMDRFNALLEQRNSVLKLTESEIKELIATYKAKIKHLKC